MIEIKKCNYITGDNLSVSYGLNEIIRFLDLSGRNIVLFTRPKSSNTTSLKYLVSNKLEFRDYSDFKNISNDKSNLFRIDLIVVDLWHVRLSGIDEYKKVLDNTGIDYIIVAKEYHYKDSDSVTDYHIKKESVGSQNYNYTEPEYIITNKINGWSTDIGSLIKSYIRDKKIDGIIGD